MIKARILMQTFKIISTLLRGVSAKFSDDGMFLLTKFTNSRGSVTLHLKWNDDKEDGKSSKENFCAW